MTVLEIDQRLAAAAPPLSPGYGWRQPEVRAEVAAADRRASDPGAGSWESTGQAAARLVAAHVPNGVLEGPSVLVEVDYRGEAGRHQLGATGRMYGGQLDGKPFAAVLAVADPLVMLIVSHAGQATARWALVPRGPSVTARADALRLVRVMRGEGELLLQAAEQPPLRPLKLGVGQGWTDDDEREWQLFEDLATLEEWSGQTITMPSELTAEEVARAAQAALWARTERIDASLTGPLSFTVPPAGDLDAVDELRLQQDFGATVGRQDLPLGTGEVHVAVDVLSVDGPRDQGLFEVTARPRRERIVFVLRAPPERRLPAVRTQPPRPRPGPADEPASEPAVPVVTWASRRLPAALANVVGRPLDTAPSAATLLDELRGDAA